MMVMMVMMGELHCTRPEDYHHENEDGDMDNDEDGDDDHYGDDADILVG